MSGAVACARGVALPLRGHAATPCSTASTCGRSRARWSGVRRGERCRQATLCLVAAASRPASIGGALEGAVDDRRRRDDRAVKPSRARAALRASCFQNPVTQLSGTAATVWEEVAFGPRNLGLPLADDRRARRGGPATLADRARSPSATRGGCRAARRSSWRSRRCSRCGRRYLVLDEPTSQLDPRARGSSATRLRGLAGDRDRRSCSSSTRPTCSRAWPRGSWSSTAGGSSLERAGRRRPRRPALAALGVEPPSARSGSRRAGRRPGVDLPDAARARTVAMTAAVAAARIAWASSTPTGRGRSRRVDSTIAAGRAGRDRRPERVAASRRWSATSTACSARPRAASCSTAATDRPTVTSPSWRATSGSRSRTPTARSSRGTRRREVAFGPRNLGCAGRDARRGGRRGAGGGRPGRRRRDTNPYDLGYSRRKLLAHRRRSWRWARRSSCSTSRRPVRTRAASRASRRIVGELAAAGRTVDRDQPRHALRRRDVRAGRRHARRAGHPRRAAGRGLRRGGLAGARLDLPRAAARRPGRGAPRPRVDADRRRARRRASTLAADPAASRRRQRRPTTSSRNDVSMTSMPAITSRDDAAAAGGRAPSRPRPRTRPRRGTRGGPPRIRPGTSVGAGLGHPGDGPRRAGRRRRATDPPTSAARR